MRFLLVIVTVFLMTACTLNEPQEEIDLSVNDEISKNDSSLLEKVDRKDLQRELKFNKDILFVHVSEVNNEALHERPVGGISSQDAYVKNGRELHMFHDAKLPVKETNMIVMSDKFNHDYLLDYELIMSEEEVVAIEHSTIDNEYVNNNNRLFSNENVIIEDWGNGSIKVSLDNKVIEIPSGGEERISRTNEGIESDLIVINYGYLNSSSDMSYEVLESQLTVDN